VSVGDLDIERRNAEFHATMIKWLTRSGNTSRWLAQSAALRFSVLY
jgi:hypothetical protein